MKSFECPGLGEGMCAQHVAKGAADFVGDLQDQRAGETVLEIGRDEAADMAEVMPDRAFEQKRFQPLQRFGREQIVEINRSGPALAEAVHEHAEIGPLVHRAPGKFRRAAKMMAVL